MKKLFIILLPLAIACNSATQKQETTAEVPATETIDKQQEMADTVAEKTESNTGMQAVKWKGIKELNDNSFKQDVLSSSAITLVDFNATWCGPCKLQKPILDKLVKEYKGKINFASVDVDQCPQTAQQYRISSIPTLSFYQNSKQVKSTVGLTSYEDLKEMIDAQLKAKE